MKFSERMGFVPVDKVLQTEGMTDALRNSIWNAMDRHIWFPYEFHDSFHLSALSYADRFSEVLWSDFFKERVDQRPEEAHDVLEFISNAFVSFQWYEVYDFVEFVVDYAEDAELVAELNKVFEREFAGFRLIDNIVCPVTDETSVEALNVATAENTWPFSNAQIHLRQAMQHLAQREKPDFRNSIKESISAVESIASELSGRSKATLGEALKVLEKEGHLHPALRSAFSALYGYTSDAEGIRHAILGEPNLDVNDATYFLVSCAAFINYLKSKHASPT